MKKSYYVFPAMVLAIVLILVTACKKEDPPTKPSLSTTVITNITTTTATSGGVISDAGGATITANGVCWGKTENPTIEGFKTTEGISTGQFVSNITGLDAGETYHVRAYATNEVGTSYGDGMTFLTLGQAPSGLAQTPTNITATGATLNGTVNPNDLSTTVTFEYGITTSYGSTAIASESPVTGNAMVNVSASITGLTPATTYHYRIKTVNSLGTTYSEDMTFTTLGIPPTATTSNATNKSTTGATLNGTVNANNTSTVVTFEYGITTSYGQTITATPSPVTGTSNANVSASMAGLTVGTTYHFRVKAVNSVGTTFGSDMTFTTTGLPPTAITLDVTNKTETGAKLNGTVNANNASTVITFEYGTTSSYGQTVTATPSPVTGTSNTNVSASISGLTAGKTYHFRVKAVNSVGTTYGDDKLFTTLYSPPPTDGLSAYYPFNGNANDESVNNFNGTVTGAALSPDRFGNNNSAYYFNGISNKIYIGNSLIVQDKISVSCWVKSTGTSGQIISTGSRNSYRIGKTADGVDCGLYLSDATDGYGIGANAIVDCSEWIHVVIVYNGSDVKLFINGQLKNSSAGVGSVFCNQTVYLNFGTYQWGSSCSDWYKGYLDDVRLYNRAINTEEINALYHEGGW